MTHRLSLRRHLYAQRAATRFSPRRRRALRRQIALLSAGSDEPDGGACGVREPRRPLPPTLPSAQHRRLG